MIIVVVAAAAAVACIVATCVIAGVIAVVVIIVVGDVVAVVAGCIVVVAYTKGHSRIESLLGGVRCRWYKWHWEGWRWWSKLVKVFDEGFEFARVFGIIAVRAPNLIIIAIIRANIKVVAAKLGDEIIPIPIIMSISSYSS